MQGEWKENSETAQLSSSVGAIAIVNLVNATVGSKEMKNIVWISCNQGSVEVKSVSAIVFKSVCVENLAAKIPVQDD